MALAESCIAGGIGFEGEWEIADRLDAALFGEGQSRVVISVDSTNLDRLQQLAIDHGVPLQKLGITNGKQFVIEGLVDLPLEDLADAWHNGLQRAIA